MRSTFFLFPLLLAACAAGSAVSPTTSPRSIESGAVADWPAVRMSGPYSVKLPPGLERVPGTGIDSLVDRYAGPGLRLTFDYGAMACGISGQGGRHMSTLTVDGRRVAVERYAERAENGRGVARLEARMHGTDLPPGSAAGTSRECLTIHAECAAARDCDVAERVVSTVRLGPTTREAAIAAAIAEHPKLAVYRHASLPPHSIEVERDPSGGWRLAFLRSGSGINSILDAQCYRVSRFGEVTPAGAFARSGRDVRDLNLETCRPR
jgi:hypothetical protein